MPPATFQAPARIMGTGREVLRSIMGACFLCVSLIALFGSDATHAQIVAAVRGETVIISAGKSSGVKPGMRARLCREEIVGGSKIDACAAVISVVSVASRTSEGRILRGDAQAIAVGFRVVFDQSQGITQDGSAAQFMAEGNRLRTQGDYRHALSLYRRLYETFPNDSRASEAKKLATECETKISEASAKRKQLQKEAQNRARATQLVHDADILVHAGAWKAALNAARSAMKLDPKNVDALAVEKQAEEGIAHAKSSNAQEGTRRGGADVAPVQAVNPISTVKVMFVSARSVGVLSLYAGSDLILQKSFRFVQVGSIQDEFIPGGFQETKSLRLGQTVLQVVVALEGEAPRHLSVQGDFREGGKRELIVQVDKHGRVSAALR